MRKSEVLADYFFCSNPVGKMACSAMEAKLNARKQLSGGAVYQALNPSFTQERSRRSSKNFARENYRYIKSIEAANHERERLVSAESPPLFKLSEFEKVLPRVDSGFIHDFGKDPETKKVLPPPAKDSGKAKNFLGANVAKLKLQERRNKEAAAQVQQSKDCLSTRKTAMGQVPKYLVERKIEMARALEERRKKLEESKIPTGFVLITESERMAVLQFLRNALRRLMKEYQSLPPIVYRTAQIKQKAVLEAHMALVDQGLEFFQRRNIYVLAEDWTAIRTELNVAPSNTELNLTVFGGLTRSPLVSDPSIIKAELKTKKLFASKISPADTATVNYKQESPLPHPVNTLKVKALPKERGAISEPAIKQGARGQVQVILEGS